MDLPTTAQSLHALGLREGWEPEVERVMEITIIRFRREGQLLSAAWDDGFIGGFANPYRNLRPPMPMIRFNYHQFRQVLQIPVDDFEWPAPPSNEPDDERQIMAWEREYLGAYITKHPLEYVDMGRYPDAITAETFRDEDQVGVGDRVQLLGLVEDAEVARARRSGNWWAKFGLSDLTGIVPCLAFGKVAQQIDTGALVHIRGKVETRDDAPIFIASVVKEVTW